MKCSNLASGPQGLSGITEAVPPVCLVTISTLIYETGDRMGFDLCGFS